MGALLFFRLVPIARDRAAGRSSPLLPSRPHRPPFSVIAPRQPFFRQQRSGTGRRPHSAAERPPEQPHRRTRGSVAVMEHRGASPLLLALALLSALCWRARALPPRGAAFPAVPRLGNRLPFDAASESDRAHGSLKSESDILQNTLPENEKFYFDLSRIIDSSQDSPVKRHSDAVFTDNYSRFRKQMAVKKYLNSVLTGKRSQEELNPAKLRGEAEILEPSFSENYDDVSVDELLSHLPLDL